MMDFFFFFLYLKTDTEQIRETLRKGLEFNSKTALPPISSQKQSHERAQWVFLPHVTHPDMALCSAHGVQHDESPIMCSDSEPHRHLSCYRNCFTETRMLSWFVAIMFPPSCGICWLFYQARSIRIVKSLYIPVYWQDSPLPFLWWIFCSQKIMRSLVTVHIWISL